MVEQRISILGFYPEEVLPARADGLDRELPAFRARFRRDPDRSPRHDHTKAIGR